MSGDQSDERFAGKSGGFDPDRALEEARVRVAAEDNAAVAPPDPSRETVDDARIPKGKQFFKIGEVSKITGLKPYVLRYWETEFSWLRPTKTSSRQRLYRRQDIAMILQIKRLRYEENLTIASAKEHIKKTRRPSKVGSRRLGKGLTEPPSKAPQTPSPQLGLGLPTAVPRTADLARRLAEMRQQVLDLAASVKE